MGDIVRIYIKDHNDNFMTDNTKYSIYFYTVKDKLEIAFLSKDTNILYLNEDYIENKYIQKIIREIKKKYNVEKTSRYFNLGLSEAL